MLKKYQSKLLPTYCQYPNSEQYESINDKRGGEDLTTISGIRIPKEKPISSLFRPEFAKSTRSLSGEMRVVHSPQTDLYP